MAVGAGVTVIVCAGAVVGDILVCGVVGAAGDPVVMDWVCVASSHTTVKPNASTTPREGIKIYPS